MPINIVVIGAVALGPKAACRFKRLEPDSNVTLVDQSSIISYGGCGIPYFVSGDISDPLQLQATSFNMTKDEYFFQKAKDIQVLTNTRAISIDRENKEVHIENIKTLKRDILPYDKLVLATGSLPRQLKIDGLNLSGVHNVSNIKDAIAIKKMISHGEVEKAAIIGAGAIGLEMADALTDLWDIETTVIEIEDQLLSGLISSNISHMAQRHMEEHGVTFYLSEKVVSLEGNESVKHVVTDKRKIDTDLVILAAGVTPNSELAKTSGLKVSPSGAIVVNSKLQTSDLDIYSGGDCIELRNLITDKPVYLPLGSLANRQGRVIGTNLAGGDDEFDGAVGSFVIKLFDISVASAGLSIGRALKEGFNAISTFVVQFDKAHFYPGRQLIAFELVIEKETGRILGIQGTGDKNEGVVGRINTVAAILKYNPTTKTISNLEMAYSPPFSSAMDILNALGNAADNILSERNRTINVDEFAQNWNDKENSDICFLDCRGKESAEPYLKKYPMHWKNIPQDELRARIDEVPKDKKILLICNTGARSYESQVTLEQLGIENTLNLQGGMTGIMRWGVDI